LLGNLAEDLITLNRYDEAKDICREIIEKEIDSYETHRNLYWLGAIEGDENVRAEQIAWYSGRADEHFALSLQAGTAAFGGKWRTAQDFTRRAVELAKRLEDKENAALYSAEQALRIVFWSSGKGLPTGQEAQLKPILKTQTGNALKLSDNRETINRAALALACAGERSEAEALMEKLKAERPKDSINNELWFPTIRAAILLQTGKAKEAIEELEIAERMERAAEFYPQYLRGLAYLESNKPKTAVKEFNKILNNRGEVPLSSVYPLAQLGKASATKNKAEYEKFFELWKDADKDMPALIEAKKEYELLT
jgi:tetratricopeptide (TPR) repeat protein